MNRTLSKVSIILPTYNGAKYIRQAIDSCLEQTYKNIEVIIVDDCSSDETPDIIKSYNDARIRYLRHERNKRLPCALNTGFAEAGGNYLTWTSDDNQYLPEAIEKMVGHLDKNEGVDLVYADCWAYYQETGEKKLREWPEKLDFKEANQVGPCFLYTRRAYKSIGNYNLGYELVEDYDYWIRICKKFTSRHYPHPLYIYTEHSESLKRTKTHSIRLFIYILKYQNGYISLSELGEAIITFCSDIIRAQKSKKEIISICIKNSFQVFRLSFSLWLLCFLLLIYFTVIKSPKFIKKSIIPRI